MSVSSCYRDCPYLTTVDSAKDVWEQLADVAELTRPQAKNRAEFIEECKSGKLDDVVAAYRTFPSASITGNFDKELIDVLPKGWKFLSHNGEFDNVSLLPHQRKKTRLSSTMTQWLSWPCLAMCCMSE